jgi:hypothetical protein
MLENCRRMMPRQLESRSTYIVQPSSWATTRNAWRMLEQQLEGR